METPGVNLSLSEPKAAAALYTCSSILCYTVIQTLSNMTGDSVKRSIGEQEHPCLTSSLKIPGALTMKNVLISIQSISAPTIE